MECASTPNSYSGCYVGDRGNHIFSESVDYTVSRLRHGLLDAFGAYEGDTASTIERYMEVGQSLRAESFTIVAIRNPCLFNMKIRGALEAGDLLLIFVSTCDEVTSPPSGQCRAE